MNIKRVTEMLCGLRILPFFPGDENAMLALVRMVGEMATSEDQVRWLVNRMTSGIYTRWPGPHEMRACFCSRYRPQDGINAYSTVYLDGIPSERAAGLQIAAPATAQIEAGEAAKPDKRPLDALHVAMKTLEMTTRSISGPATAEEIAAAPEWLRRLEGYE